MKTGNKKLYIIAGAAAVLIIAAVIIFLSSRSRDDETAKEVTAESTSLQEVTVETSIKDTEVSDEPEGYLFKPEEYIQVWFFDKSGEYPKWDQPRPYVNPMGHEDRYLYIEAEEKGYRVYDYADKSNTLIKKYIYGDSWTLCVPFDEKKTEEQNRQFIIDIEKYIETKNGEIMGYYKDSIVFVMKDENDVRWWAEAVIEFEQIILNIVKQDELKIGQTLVINTSDYEGNSARFASYNPGDEFQSFYLEYDGGEVSFDIYTDNSYGSYRRICRTHDTVHKGLGTGFFFDNIMYDPGLSNWEVSWYDPSETGEIKITLLETGSIPRIKYGEPLGAIKVSSEHVSGIEAFPSGGNDMTIYHPEFSYDDFYLDKTPDGDHIMFVPAGLWDVKIYPLGDSLVTDYKTLMVPVNSGEVTVVEIPAGISNALKAEAAGYDERGIKIGTVTEDTQKKQVSFTFTLLDRSTKDILPDRINTRVMENGLPAELLSVERVKTPPDVVLLIDSSGSMRGQMNAALDAARSFVEGLQDDSSIRIIDFDDTPKELKGSTKAEAIRNLALIQVGGDTALYDAVSLGADMLADADRPVLVVFTDGENDVKYSGGLTFDETAEIVREASVPMFTIGFGKGHDASTLESFAEISGGEYFSADNDKALTKVFEAINERLGSTFEAAYTRPAMASVGDVPVVSFVVDTSGSMLTDDEINGSRIHNVKNLLRQFISGLPDGILMQLTGFHDVVSIVQALTTDRLRMLRGIGGLAADGGTEITGSVLASYMTLKQIPSSKKVLIYITDAALDTTYYDNDFFIEILSEIKKEDIRVLWVGLGIVDEEEDFRLAAELSGGDYIITEDLALLNEAFEKILNEVIETPDSELSNIFIEIEKTNETGAREIYSTSALAKLTPVGKSGEAVSAETIKYLSGGPLRHYDPYTAAYISGCSMPAEETIITKRMKAGGKGSNEAAEIATDSIIFMKDLYGIEPPANYRFMAITMDMRNILEEQEVTVYPDGSSHPSSWVSGGAKGKVELMKIPYMIPDFSSHFSVTYNNQSSHPASSATWLTEKPLAAPGDRSFTIGPDQGISGTLVFIVPDVPMEQLSLHFYDINYGHIDVAMVGEMKRTAYDIVSLPKEEPLKLSDTFSLEVTGRNEIDGIAGAGEDGEALVPGTGASFMVLEANFISQMQALLNIDPMNRFSLRFKTESGDFYIPINPATVFLPAGFSNQRMMAPGSFNTVRWLFEIPSALRGNASEIFVDLKDEDKSISAGTGQILGGGIGSQYGSEYADLTVNNLVKLTGGINEYYGSYIIADITIHDKKDGYASSGIAGLFSVVTDKYFEMMDETEDNTGSYEETGSGGLDSFGQWGKADTEDMLLPYSITQQLILGYTDDSIVYDGTSRRGIILYRAPDTGDKDWYLYSHAFDGLKMKVSDGTYDQGLLAERISFETDDTYAEKLNAAIAKAVERYRLANPEKTEQVINGNISLGEEVNSKQEIPVPTVCAYGVRKIEEIDSIDDLVKAMKKLRYIPSPGRYEPYEHSFSKEALMTQGFGMEQDYANMFIEVLSKLGYQPKLKVVRVTERGLKELEAMSGIKDITVYYLPAISYVDDDNEYHVMVMPFMEELDTLRKLVYLDHTQTYMERRSAAVWLEVNVHGYLTEKGAREHLGDISDALGGGDDGTQAMMIENMYGDYVPLDMLSLDAVDIGMAIDGNRARVYLITANGEIFGDRYIDLDMIDVRKVEISLDLPHKSNVVHVARLEENAKIDDVFFTVSINAPDLTDKAAAVLKAAADKVYAKALAPNESSALRWYGRSVISEFIVFQTAHDQRIINDMQLVAGRVYKPRVLVVTQKAGTKLSTSLSLLETNEQIHAGSQDDIRIFNILSGIYASTLEAAVLSAEANGIESIWSKAPQGTSLIFLEYIDPAARAGLENAGMPDDIIRHLENSTKMILITDKPSVIDGKERWAWFEIDTKTYEIIAVIDTLERGAFVESTVVDLVKSAAQYAVGAFKGIETSVWSVAAFSLEKDDYEEILKAAKALALGIADRFGISYGPFEASVGGKPAVAQALGPVKFSFDGSANASQNILGFTDGYKAGVEYYFSN